MIEDIVSSVLEALFSIVFEILIKGPGYLLLRLFQPAEGVEPDGCLVVMIGLAFWAVVGIGIWWWIVWG